MEINTDFHGSPLSKSANIEKKFEWAQAVCEFLTENFDEDTVRQIRMDCACGSELGKGKKIKEIYEKENDVSVFVERANNLKQGFTIEYDGKYFYLIYPQCYCSCVKRIDEHYQWHGATVRWDIRKGCFSTFLTRKFKWNCSAVSKWVMKIAG